MEGGVVERVGRVVRVVGGDAENAFSRTSGPVGGGESQPIVRAGVQRVNLVHSQVKGHY